MLRGIWTLKTYLESSFWGGYPSYFRRWKTNKPFPFGAFGLFSEAIKVLHDIFEVNCAGPDFRVVSIRPPLRSTGAIWFLLGENMWKQGFHEQQKSLKNHLAFLGFKRRNPWIFVFFGLFKGVGSTNYTPAVWCQFHKNIAECQKEMSF